MPRMTLTGTSIRPRRWTNDNATSGNFPGPSECTIFKYERSGATLAIHLGHFIVARSLVRTG